MRFRSATRDRDHGKTQMSAMIDIVFLLLVFFVMTFRIVLPEGDIAIAPPAMRVPAAGIGCEAFPPIQVRLAADERGGLAGVWMNGQRLGDLDELHQLIKRVTSDVAMPLRPGDEPEVVFDCDARLNYGHTMAAINAVGGFRDASGDIVPLVKQFRFATSHLN